MHGGIHMQSVKVAIIFAVTILLVGIIGIQAYVSTKGPNQTIAVTGNADVLASPDVVRLYFTVLTNGATAAQAKNENANIVQNVEAAILKQGLQNSDVATQNFVISPHYDYSNSGQTQKGYDATYSLSVKLSSSAMDKAGSVIDSAVNAGATVASINFELSPALQNQYTAEALKDAVVDAKTKAQSIASGLNRQVGNVVSVSAVQIEYRPWPIYQSNGIIAPEAAKAAVTSIQPGQQDIPASLTVSYQIT
jgi:uncharacterized protein